MSELVVEVDGRRVRVSSLDRVLYPRTGTTKAEVIDYYIAVAAHLLPHLRGRPVTLRRFPQGLAGPGFFQTRTPPHPEWVRTATLHFPRTGKTVHTPVIDDCAGLVWAANLTTVELHPYLGCAEDPAHPTALVFDLDPGPPATVLDAARVALAVRDVLAGAGVACWAKSSGGKGMHVYAPVASGTTYEQTKQVARAVARVLADAEPDRVVDRMTRELRPGKVFIDWSQNDMGKSTVSPYSLRATQVPLVSTPLTWAEVERGVRAGDPSLLVATPEEMLRRLERHGEVFAALLAPGPPLPPPAAVTAGARS